jgi:pimeloyl-ACP methyl ester carboxylesterase
MRRLLLLLVLVAAALPVGTARAGVAAVYGPSDARRVLILVPGLGGGAGNFAVIGPELAKRVPNLQVWAVDRRGDALEDTIGFTAAEPGTASRYYFDRLSLGTSAFDPNRAARHQEARGWGLATTLADLRPIVLRARAGGKRKVLLGGHSLGAATALSYAAWDFAGTPGYRDLSGLVLIDGGQLGTFGMPTVATAKAQLAALRAAPQPFEDSFGVGVPWIFGIFGQLAAMEALWAPDAPSAVATSPLLPASFRPSSPVTNRGFFESSLAQGGIDWYFPTRLRIDLLGAAGLVPGPVTNLLGLRERHLAAVNVPLYAFATGDIPTTATGARAFLAKSKSPRARSLVTSDPGMRHSDPLCTPWERSRFLRTLVPWLRAQPG